MHYSISRWIKSFACCLVLSSSDDRAVICLCNGLAFGLPEFSFFVEF